MLEEGWDLCLARFRCCSSLCDLCSEFPALWLHRAYSARSLTSSSSHRGLISGFRRRMTIRETLDDKLVEEFRILLGIVGRHCAAGLNRP